MPYGPQADGASAFVDFTATDSNTPLIFEDRLHAGGVTLVRCQAPSNLGGGRIISPQTTIVVSTGPAFDLEWQTPDDERRQASTIGRGRVMVYAAGVPVWKRWQASPSIFVVALAPEFVEHVRQTAFEPSNGAALRTFAGLEDRVAYRLTRLAERELQAGGSGGRVYIDSVATALTVHLLRTYGGDRRIERRLGGLAPAQVRRVTEYVAAHLAENVGLAELAGVAGLSPHHFGGAFKTATGMSPHQYVIERRVERAQELLRHGELSLAQVAFAAGFSSQSHLTTNFQRVTGITPARFRRFLD